MSTTTAPRTLFDIGEELATLQAAIVEAGGEVTPEIEAQLDALFTEFGTKIDKIGYKRRAIQMQASLHKERATLHAAQAKAYEAMESRLDGYLLAVMTAHNLKKIQGDDFTASIGETKRLIVDDPSQIPQVDRYWRIPAPEVNKEAVKRDVTQGTEVPGVHLESHFFVRVK